MKTSTITIRLPLETIKEIERMSKVTRLRPSVLCAFVLQEKLHEWVQEYSEDLARELGD